MTREELIKKVALKMDEVSSSDEVIVPVGTGDNNPLYTQIDNLLNESVNDVLMKAPIYRIQSQIASLDTFTTKDIHAYTETRKAVVFSVPNDFIRFVQVNDDAFARPIVDLAIEGDSIDKRQHNKNLVAKNAKPVAVFGHGDSGRIITCYSYSSKDTISPTLRYVKRYDRDDLSETGLDEYIANIVSWTCAGKVFSIQGDVTKSKICNENATALIL